jgi:hypothetical protein
MNNHRQAIKHALDRAASGMTTRHLAEVLDDEHSAETLGAIELLCVLSSDFQNSNGNWLTTRVGKAGAVLVALENFVTSTGKRIFRSSAALEALPAEMLPTEDELVEILESSGQRFVLLPNQMIKFNN